MTGNKRSGNMNRRARQFALRAHYRQGGLCFWCKTPMILKAADGEPRLMTADHVVEVMLGGPTRHQNIVAACLKCNNERSAQVLDYRPNSVGPVVYSAGDDTPISPFAKIAGVGR